MWPVVHWRHACTCVVEFARKVHIESLSITIWKLVRTELEFFWAGTVLMASEPTISYWLTHINAYMILYITNNIRTVGIYLMGFLCKWDMGLCKIDHQSIKCLSFTREHLSLRLCLDCRARCWNQRCTCLGLLVAEGWKSLRKCINLTAFEFGVVWCQRRGAQISSLSYHLPISMSSKIVHSR